MNLRDLKVVITLGATIVAGIFIYLIYDVPEYSTMVLQLEVIILPSIYIIGYYYVESKIRDDNNEDLDQLLFYVERKKEENFKLKEEIKILKYKLKHSNKDGKEKES